MPFLTGLLAIGSAVASIVSGVSKTKQAEKEEKAQKKFEDDLFKAQEDQKKENEKAMKKQAIMRAFGVNTPSTPKQVAGVRPPRGAGEKEGRLANIFGGISGGLNLAAGTLANQPSTQKTRADASKIPGPGAVNLKPTQTFRPIV